MALWKFGSLSKFAFPISHFVPRPSLHPLFNPFLYEEKGYGDFSCVVTAWGRVPDHKNFVSITVNNELLENTPASSPWMNIKRKDLDIHCQALLLVYMYLP